MLALRDGFRSSSSHLPVVRKRVHRVPGRSTSSVSGLGRHCSYVHLLPPRRPPDADEPLNLRIQRPHPRVALELAARPEHDRLLLRGQRRHRRRGRAAREAVAEQQRAVPEHEQRVLLRVVRLEPVRVPPRGRGRVRVVLARGERLRGEAARDDVRVREIDARPALPAPPEGRVGLHRKLDEVARDEDHQHVSSRAA
jgi:hypothetical protein